MFCAGQAPGGYALERVFGRAFAQMRLVNTARVLTSPPLHKITPESIALLRIRPAPARLVLRVKMVVKGASLRALSNKCALTIQQVLPAAPLSEIARKSIALLCIRPTPARLVFKSKDGNTRCVFTRAFAQMRLVNTARGQTLPALRKITCGKGAFLRILATFEWRKQIACLFLFGVLT